MYNRWVAVVEQKPERHCSMMLIAVPFACVRRARETRDHDGHGYHRRVRASRCGHRRTRQLNTLHGKVMLRCWEKRSETQEAEPPRHVSVESIQLSSIEASQVATSILCNQQARAGDGVKSAFEVQ